MTLCGGLNKHTSGHSLSYSVPELLKGVGVLVGLAVLLRLMGSSSSPREKNWPLLEVVVAGDLRLRRSEKLCPFSRLLSSSPTTRVLRLG